MTTVEQFCEDVWCNPFERGSWHGRFVSFDDTDTADFTEQDVAEVIAYGQTSPDDWDGNVAAVMQLHDGRFVVYETYWGPTGHGFSEDAYGGDADLVFASTFVNAVTFGLTDEGRRLCNIPLAVPEKRDTE